MGIEYGYKIPANQLGKWKNVWVLREYGLPEVWLTRESTVLPSTKASRLVRGSSMPRVERSFVVDRSSSLSHLRDLCLREFQLCCDNFHEFFARSVAAPTLSVLFVLVVSFFTRGSSIGSKSRK